MHSESFPGHMLRVDVQLQHCSHPVALKIKALLKLLLELCALLDCSICLDIGHLPCYGITHHHLNAHDHECRGRTCGAMTGNRSLASAEKIHLQSTYCIQDTVFGHTQRASRSMLRITCL